jgi:hypothetical protein
MSYELNGVLSTKPAAVRSQSLESSRLKKGVNMNRVFLLIAGVATLGLYFIVGPTVVSTFRRYRGRRTIICPETDQIAEMEIKAGHAGVMAALGKHVLRVKWCSLWPRRKGCAEECLQDDWQSGEDPRNSDSSHDKLN